MTDAPPQTLDELRRAIDATDDALLDLVNRRMALAEAVRDAKTGAPGPLWRPAREADILRRLFARAAPAVPFEAVYNIWRELISASIAVQGEFVVVRPRGAIGFAGAHFPGCDLDEANRPEDALARAVAEPNAVAEIVGPDEEGVWPELPKFLAARARAPDLNFLARLPVLDYALDLDEGSVAPRQTFIVGRAPCEKSGDDMTLVASYWDAERRLPPSPRKRPRLAEAEQKRAEAAAAEGGLLAAVHDGLSVFVYEGFVEPGDARLAPLRHPVWLGAFARPFLIEDDDSDSDSDSESESDKP